MIALLLLTVVLIIGSAFVVYLLGYCLGGDHARDELLRVRAEASAATRQLHRVSRQAFIAMSEAAERHRR